MISAPSGAGKTTIIKGLLARRPDYVLSVSATTRPPRPGERDGRDYHFLSPQEFERLEREGAFLETASVHGNRYGTLRGPVERALQDDRTVVLEIDIQGARSIRAAFPEALLVFVRPPSWEVLEARLRSRGTEDAAAVERRLAAARAELDAEREFDRSVVNDDLGEAVERLTRIIDGNDAGGSTPATPEKEMP